jgi:hypothetical protein
MLIPQFGYVCRDVVDEEEDEDKIYQMAFGSNV